ncbi:MAG: hypothetical protein ABII21_00160 [bacterium]
MTNIAAISERLRELRNFEYLVPALLAQIDFLEARPIMMEEDVNNPDRLITSMAHEIAETYAPRSQFERIETNPERESERNELASETADIVVFGLSALISKDNWEENELNLLRDSFTYAEYLAKLGDFALNKETVRKIKEKNDEHYPVELFAEGLPYQMSRRVCKALRTYFGMNFWQDMRKEGVGQFLRDVAASPDGKVPDVWNVASQLDHDEYMKLKEAASQLVGFFDTVI